MGEIYLQRKRVKEQKHLNGTSSLKLKQNEQGRPFRGWKIVQYKCNWYVVISEKANDSLSLYIYINKRQEADYPTSSLSHPVITQKMCRYLKLFINKVN
jgi:hypothetical protein